MTLQVRGRTAVTLLVWLSYVCTGCVLPDAMSNSLMWGLPPAARYTLSVLISILLTCACAAA